MKLDKQSNLYTIIYIVVMVLVVGTALAFTSLSLKDRQQSNADADRMRQILAAAHLTASGDSVAELFKKHITAQPVYDSRGEQIAPDGAFDIDVAAEVRKPEAERRLPVFVCETLSGPKYILPLYGAGLWGPIWGYIAFDQNGDTIYGCYFSHQGETPGLGAEIEKPAFQKQFEGKNIFNKEGIFQSVKVVKNGQEPADGQAWVHAVSGGTITSQGVQKMLRNSLEPYETFFKSLTKK